MNKSLVLVMCDVLVLSAMSLSTGNFESADGGGCSDTSQNIQSDSSVTNGPEDRIEKLEALLSATSNALVLVSRDLIDKDRQLHLSEVAVGSLTKDLSVAVGRYDQATNEVNGLMGRMAGQGRHIRELEYLLGTTSNNLVLVSQDLVAKSNALSQSVVAISDLSNELSIVAGRYNVATSVVGVVSNRIESIELLLSATSNQLVLASRGLLNFSNALYKSTISLVELSNDYQVVSGQYTQATNELSDVRWQLEDEIGAGYVKRKSLIETCKYGLFVKVEGAKKGEVYYSPLIRVGTNIFVMAYMPRKDASRFEQVQVMSMNYKRVGTVDSAWGLSGRYDQDIILFKLNVPSSMPALSLGVSKIGLRDHYYWFRSRGSDVSQAGVMSADAESSWKEYKQIVAGDMLISERCASVVKMATKKVAALKNEVGFGKITERDLVLLK